MNKQTFESDGKTLALYPPQSPELPLFLTFLTPQEADALAALIDGKAALLAVDEPLWEHAFTPWPAPAAFKKAPDFSGGADAYLQWLTETALSQALETGRLKPQWNALLGYSLAGLFAAYAAYRSHVFTRTASVSGSLWFDGWTDFIQTNPLSPLPQKACFSVGDKEKNSKNPRMAVVETATLATQQNWQQQGVECVFELNAGGHFENVPLRLYRAAEYLLG
ncbi:hypothetical protein BG910_11955 [Neisseria chenwenguii]|uniref:Esterase n=1 Tax=Neisseria chenwenguii TaxID=1853278 RepID=A0A220S4L1_9NEIS|nr:alpha/beta hydrolase-fold protein [Neisseria chenwenguii]ASK28356.1 hypothetical protein BG910_11955 [Neisseria chenwenguii]